VDVTADGTVKTADVSLGADLSARDAAKRLLEAGTLLRSVDGESPEIRQAYADALTSIAEGKTTFAGKTALVTGASDRSIALEVVKVLLTGGARVIVTTSSLSPQRVRFYRKLFQDFAGRGAELAVVPFNQGSRQDVAQLVKWITSAETVTAGAKQKVVKEPWLVDLLVPFGAGGEEGTLAELRDRSLATLRVLLFGVEALVGELVEIGQEAGWPAERPFVGLYPVDPADPCPVTIAVPEGSGVAPRGHARAHDVPAGPVLSTIHVGPYDELPLAYTALLTAAHERGHEPRDPVVETYLTDPARVSPAEYVTRLEVLISP